MKSSVALAASLALLSLQQTDAADNKPTPIPDTCPVTRSTPEARFTPPAPSSEAPADSPRFWYGSDSLYTSLYSDGRWARNKSFWYRKNAEWRGEFPYQFTVSLKRLDAEEPMVTVPNVNNAIMGEEVAMLIMLELPKRGCWQVTANYKSDYLSFVAWAD